MKEISNKNNYYLCNMHNRFLKYIEQEGLIEHGEKVILGVSGGIDSMVMADLFYRTGIPHVLAHCNFKLRNEEADQDESFIKDYARDRNIELFIKHFDTAAHASSHNISIQMSARQLRFDWFESILDKEGYDLIATAHHLDDQIETFFLNLMRSTGIAGLHGILPKQGRLIHPMLFASRMEINQYARENNIRYREDSSNLTVKYARNKIRHQVLPILEEIHPNFKNILTSNIKRLRETEKIYRSAVSDVIKYFVTTIDRSPAISIDALKKTNAPATYLFEYLAPYQFKFSTVEDIINSLDGISGKTFYSPSHKIIRDRNYLLLIENREDTEKKGIMIHRENVPGYTDTPARLTFNITDITGDFKITEDPKTALIDAEKISWPLKISQWEKGDHFFPLGMQQSKKISDFLIDEKIPIHNKQNTFILRSGKKVVWIIGKRLDNRFKITDKTTKVLKIKLLED